MPVTVKFAKVNPRAIIPTKESENSSYDIYACFSEDELKIPAHCTVMIPTGIASAIESGWGFRIEERGSTGAIGMKKSAGVIDSGYRGEWFIAITNTNDNDIIISKLVDEVKCVSPLDNTEKPRKYKNRNLLTTEIASNNCILLDTVPDVIYYPYNKAIAQATIEKIYEPEIEEISYEDLLKIPSKRKDGKLGSSGK